MPIIEEDDDEDVIELGISVEKVRFIIVKARQFDAKEDDADPDEGSNAADDGMADVLEDKPEEDAVRSELQMQSRLQTGQRFSHADRL